MCSSALIELRIIMPCVLSFLSSCVAEAVKRRAFLYSISATLFVSAMCGACIFVLFKHHKKVKQCLQPLHLEIPDHYLEVHFHILSFLINWESNWMVALIWQPITKNYFYDKYCFGSYRIWVQRRIAIKQQIFLKLSFIS